MNHVGPPSVPAVAWSSALLDFGSQKDGATETCLFVCLFVGKRRNGKEQSGYLCVTLKSKGLEVTLC